MALEPPNPRYYTNDHDDEDEQPVSAKLIELIDALYKQHTVLEHTDHLSDRDKGVPF